MAEYQKFSYLIQKLCYDNSYNQNTLLKCIPALIQHAQRSDLRGLLELLNSTHDTDLQIKIFSILSGYLVSSDKNIDAIIKFNPIYDKIQSILSGGLPRKTTVVLNFLTAILYVDDEDDTTRKKSLAMHARNMIRVSGCLAIISNIYTNYMVYQDTLKSLCMCLSEICRGCEINQSYCTHLIPMRCSQGHEYIFLVLQNLIQNHTRNIQLFLESNGVALFSREFLQYDACLQLLNTLVQNSSHASVLLNKTNLIQHLSDFLRLYGPNSQRGQWASIILYHLDSQIKKVAKGPSEKSKCDVNKSINNVRDVSPSGVINNDLQISKLDNTATLLNNVMKEVFIWKSTNKFGNDQTGTKLGAFVKQTNNHGNDTTLLLDNMVFKTDHGAQNLKRSAKFKRAQESETQDLLFSFLKKGSCRRSGKTNQFSQQTYMKSQISDFISTKYDETNRTKRATISKIRNNQKNSSMSHQTFREINEEHNQSAVSLTRFRPTFVSTPKKYEKEMSKSRISYSRRATFKAKKNSKPKICRESTIIDKDIKHRSFSNRLLGAINESCTTFVKTVKNIFKKTNHTVTTSTNTENVPSCTYSFTDYMRKRDAILDDDSRVVTEIKECHELSTQTHSCTTCNDTIKLKHKLANDKYLRHTVKKLKLGINVYGCDFKKISRTFWPQDAYMTPSILYNLYRKLLIK